MRFVFDELYNVSDDEVEIDNLSSCSSNEQNEYTFINADEEDESIPQLCLPKKHNLVTKTNIVEKVVDHDEQLSPELEKMINDLNLKSKLPNDNEIILRPIVIIPSSTVITKVNNQSKLKAMDYDNEINVDTDKLISEMMKSFENKLNVIENDNKKQVELIKENKRKLEEELRRKKEEEERKRKEEEALRLKEEEERKRKEAELKQKQKDEEERKLKELEEERERKSKEEEELLKQENKRNVTITNFKTIEKQFYYYKDKIKSIKSDIIEPVKNGDAQLRSLLSKHKRKINPKFGQLTNSNSQLIKIEGELSQLIDDTKSDQLAYLWILNFISKAIVHQAENEVGVKPESSIPLGKLTLFLLIRYSEFKELIMARFVKKCPFTLGYTCKIDTETGRLNMGWKRNSNDKWEDDTTYDERMGGIITLFSVITKLKLPNDMIMTNMHPLSIENSWKLLSRISNTEINLLTNTHFIVIGFWWDSCAIEFLIKYGNQGNKLLNLICNELTDVIKDLKYVGAARLRILYEDMINNDMKSFPEMEP